MFKIGWIVRLEWYNSSGTEHGGDDGTCKRMALCMEIARRRQRDDVEGFFESGEAMYVTTNS